MNILKPLAVVAFVLVLQACKHPLAIVGEGDIVDAGGSGHGCTLGQYQSQAPACVDNEVSGEYQVNYRAEPHPGWRFVRWDGPCSRVSEFQYCRIDAQADWVAWWDANYPGESLPASTAVFEPVSGTTGLLVDGAVAGIHYQSGEFQGFTNLDGSFQYRQGTSVVFSLGGTRLGEAAAAAILTPFDLAPSAIRAGTARLASDLRKEDEPFHTVINIATLLQSFDADPGGGINIKPAVDELLANVNLDLRQPWQSFRQDFSLLSALHEANSQQLFSEPRGLLHPADVLQHLYESLGDETPTYAVTRSEFDRDGDGVPESIDTWQYDQRGNAIRREESHGGPEPFAIELWTYDESGRLTQHRQEQNRGRSVERRQYSANGQLLLHAGDFNGDGWEDKVETFQYGAGGMLIGSETIEDQDSDGTSEFVVRLSYDEQGNRVRREEDDNDDGIPERVESWRYEYDTYDNPTLTVYDQRADGEADQVVRRQYAYDTNGHLTRETYELDWDASGRANFVYSWRYQRDAEGRLTLREYDRRDDGDPESTERFEYDVRGNTTLESLDEDADGKLDSIQRFEYDDHNNRIASYFDWEGDGVTDYAEYNSYDGEDNLVLEEMDWDADGEIDDTRSIAYEYEYDTMDRLVQEAVDECGDSRPEIVNRYGYDEDGNRIFEELSRGECTESALATFEYDATGHLLRARKEGFSPFSDNFDLRDLLCYVQLCSDTYRYDELGRQVLHQTDLGDDGTVELTETWRYDDRGNLAQHAHQFPGFEFTPAYDQVDYLEYDADNRLAHQLTTRDFNSDTVPDETINTWYEADRVTREETDEDADGNPERVTVWTYTFQPGGLLSLAEAHENDSPMPVEATSYEYGDTDRLSSESRSLYDDESGQLNNSERIEYNPDGTVARREYDHDGDSTLDELELYVYDDLGNLIREYRNDYGDGIPAEITRYEYTAAGWAHFFRAVVAD